MLELVEDLDQLAANFKEYQRAVKAQGRVSPSKVKKWYYIPALDMVGAGRSTGIKTVRTRFRGIHTETIWPYTT